MSSRQRSVFTKSATEPVTGGSSGSIPVALLPPPPLPPPSSTHSSTPPVSRADRVHDFQTFVSFVFTVSIFGASTFAVIAGQMADPAEIWGPAKQPPFTLHTVRTFLGIAWLCFVLSLAVAGYSLSIMTLMREEAGGQLTALALERWDAVGVAASALLHHLIVVAFLFLSLSLVAYAGAVGWAAVGFSVLMLLFVISLSAYQLQKRFFRTKDIA